MPADVRRPFPRPKDAVATDGKRMKIRPAHRADAPAVCELLIQLGYPQNGQEETAGRIEIWAEDPSSAAYVADDGGEVLGVIAVQVCALFERAGSSGRITALVVADRARRRGVGAHLVAVPESFAVARGCLRMEVTSAVRRQDAHEFYRRCGYVDQTGRSSLFRRDLLNGVAPSACTDVQDADHEAGGEG